MAVLQSPVRKVTLLNPAFMASRVCQRSLPAYINFRSHSVVVKMHGLYQGGSGKRCFYSFPFLSSATALVFVLFSSSFAGVPLWHVAGLKYDNYFEMFGSFTY